MLVIGCGIAGLAVGSLLKDVIRRHLETDGYTAAFRSRRHPSSAIRSDDDVPAGRQSRGGPQHRAGPNLARPVLVITGTGTLFAVTAAYFGPVWHLPAYLYLAAAGMALTVIDLKTKRLPNAIVLPSYLTGSVLLAVASLIQGDPGAVLRAAAGSAAMLAGYATLALLQPAGMGAGDVKLSGVIGLYLAWLGWRELLIGWFAAFALAGTVGVCLLVTKRASRTSTIPFGPFMLVGAVAGVAIGG